jgi:translation initiation factor 3 subunit L
LACPSIANYHQQLRDPFRGSRTTNATMATYQNGVAPARAIDDDSDVEEEALVAEYKEQVQYDDGEELSQTNSLTMAQQTDDIQARLAQAAQPLDFSAPLEVKFQSYDAYCSLFHFILNSEGPVDLEPPSVCVFRSPPNFLASSRN